MCSTGARGGGGRAARSIGGRTEARRSTAPFLGQRPAASRGADGPLSSVLTTCGARVSSPLGAASAEDATARCGGPVQRPPFPGVSRGETTAGALGPRPPQTACPVVIEQPRVGTLVPAVSGQRAASSPRWGGWPRSTNSAPRNCGREPGSQGGGAPGPKRGARATLVSGVSGCLVSGGEGRGHPGGAFRGGHGPRRVSGKEPGVGVAMSE